MPNVSKKQKKNREEGPIDWGHSISIIDAVVHVSLKKMHNASFKIVLMNKL